MRNTLHAADVSAGFHGIGEDVPQEVTTSFGRTPEGGRGPRLGLPDLGHPDRVDAVGDFLEVYDGPRNGDLDVVVADAVLTRGGEVVLRAVHAGPIGTTEGAAYVWGIDRGAGAEILTTLDPPTGEGVTFDAVVIVLPDGTGSVIDLVEGGAPRALDPSSVEIAGPVISVTLPEALLPSQGSDFEDWGYNLWPRYAPDGVDPLDNTQISDFAPDASTFTARPRGRADDRPSYGAGHEEASGVLADLVDGGSTTMPAAWAANFDVL